MSPLFDNAPGLLLALEAGLALFLLLFIVFWTASSSKQRRPQSHSNSQEKNQTPSAHKETDSINVTRPVKPK